MLPTTNELNLPAQTNAGVEPPVASRKEHIEVRHGERVEDDYYWLRGKSDPEVTQYLEAENAYTADLIKPLQPFVESLYEEMLSHIKQTDLSVPVSRGAYFYYSRTEEGKQYPIRCRARKSGDGAEEILLDLNELSINHKFVSLDTFVVSDDQRLLAYTLDYTGFRQYTLHVKHLGDGTVFEDSFERVTSLAWAADNKTLFFTIEDAVTKRSDALFRHTLGTSQFERIYIENDELYDIEVAKSRDKKFIFLSVHSADTTEFHYLSADSPAEPLQLFLARRTKHRYYVDHREDLFYIRTNRTAKDFEVMTVADKNPAEENWTSFFAGSNGNLIEDVDLFRDFVVLLEKSEALNHLRLYSVASQQWTTIPFLEPVYAAFASSTPDYDSATYRYNYQSFVTPPSVYDYEVQSGKSTLLKRQEVPGGFDQTRYESERLWAPATDGTRIPISIVYKKGFRRDGRSPLFLYAYGSYGIGMSASFSSSRLALLDRGMAYAIAHIRGGDEMGEQWREDGMLMKKKNTFTDFIDSADYLIQQQWTASDKLVIEGGSAGGLLMGAVVNMRPDLFRAVHAAVPFMDVMNTMFDASLPLTIGEYLEWGNPNEKAAYDYMKSYSPYDNLEKRVYPSILVTTSLNDSQVMYWEPAKYVARLRTMKTDGKPLLLKTKMEPAGHGGASGRYDRLKDTAFEYAWLLSQVGITQ